MRWRGYETATQRAEVTLSVTWVPKGVGGRAAGGGEAERSELPIQSPRARRPATSEDARHFVDVIISARPSTRTRQRDVGE
jgi:hypothetical protein